MYVVSASYEAGQCQAPVDFYPFTHTIAEAAEQALPTREGPRRRPGITSRCITGVRELVASWFVGAVAPTHLLSVLVRLHQAPETSFVKPGSGTPFFRAVPSREPGGYTESRASSARGRLVRGRA